jgi:POT family proton-dependent oligopeptide transporter
VLVANAGVQSAPVTRFIASTGFGVTAFQMFFFAGFAFAAALAFGIVARSYPLVDYYRKQLD